MLKLNLNEINDGLSLKESVAAGALPELKAMQDAGELGFNAPLTFELNFKRLEDIIIIDGVLQGEVVINCGRCLNDYTQRLESDFTLKGAPAPQTAPRYENEVELESRDLDDFTYDGNILDLREILQEQVILALPLAPVCRDDCRGLCPNCGASLNESACGCDTKQGHPAFAALKDLL